MAAGYAFGAIVGLPVERRRKICIQLGVVAIVLFVALRFFDVYGDWSWAEGKAHSVLWFLGTTKYPASLLFLLMTLGPAILGVGLLGGGLEISFDDFKHRNFVPHDWGFSWYSPPEFASPFELYLPTSWREVSTDEPGAATMMDDRGGRRQALQIARPEQYEDAIDGAVYAGDLLRLRSREGLRPVHPLAIRVRDATWLRNVVAPRRRRRGARDAWRSRRRR